MSKVAYRCRILVGLILTATLLCTMIGFIPYSGIIPEQSRQHYTANTLVGSSHIQGFSLISAYTTVNSFSFIYSFFPYSTEDVLNFLHQIP